MAIDGKFFINIPEDIQGDLPDTAARIYCIQFIVLYSIRYTKMYMARRSHNFKK